MIAQKTKKLFTKLKTLSLFYLMMQSLCLPLTSLQLVSLSVGRVVSCQHGMLVIVISLSEALYDSSDALVSEVRILPSSNASFKHWWLWEMVTCGFSIPSVYFLLCSSIQKYLYVCISLSCYLYSAFPLCIYIVNSSRQGSHFHLYKYSIGSLSMYGSDLI